MSEVITTVNGSVYEISREDKTWRRLSWPAWSDQVRTVSGTYRSASPAEPGLPLVITADPFTPLAIVRVITTSPVQEVRYS
jgi:hypothetical protein